MLNTLFGDTWARTEKSISQFVSEFPVCTTDSSIESLQKKGDVLIGLIEALIESGSIPEEDAARLNEQIEAMRSATTYDAYKAVYDALLEEYNQLVQTP